MSRSGWISDGVPRHARSSSRLKVPCLGARQQERKFLGSVRVSASVQLTDEDAIRLGSVQMTFMCAPLGHLKDAATVNSE
jgi:hypothetical protein